MGWSSWNHFGNNGSHCHCTLGAAGLMETADAFVSSGLRDAGYKYVNMDGCDIPHLLLAFWGQGMFDLAFDPTGYGAHVSAFSSQTPPLDVYNKMEFYTTKWSFIQRNGVFYNKMEFLYNTMEVFI